MVNSAARSTAVTWEDRPWEADPAHLSAMSRCARLAARGPYSAAIPAQIADLPIELPADVSAAAEDALLAISRFDAEATLTLAASDPTTRPMELAPPSAVLLRTESASSSQIEHITAGAKALALATMGQPTGENAALVAANVRAMLAATDVAEQLSGPSLLRAHAALMDGQPHAGPGAWRTAPVWIGGRAPAPHTSQFVPPHAERIEGAMSDLLAFCDRTDLPVLVHAAVAHAQFETIHPFADGNGRTGRVLVHALLRRAGAVQRLTVPVSAGLLSDTEQYFDALTAYREGDVSPIVGAFTQASFTAALLGRELLEVLAQIRAQWETALTSRRDSAARRILPQLIAQPAVDVAWVQEHAAVSKQAAHRAIDQLVAAGILRPVGSARRNRVWVAADVTGALDDIAARAKRR